jgi:curli production assembly/transport component CsgE
MKSFFLLFLFLWIFSGPLRAQEPLLTGLIFDQTKTKAGRDFYEAFNLAWEFPSGMEDTNILVTELTDPRWGSQLQIYVEDILVYATMLKPRLEDIEEKVDEAINAVLSYFIWQAEKERALQEELKFF